MKKYTHTVLKMVVAISLGTAYLQAQTVPERFYEVNSYKAEIKITFTYEYTHTVAENRNSITASQSFEHVFETGPGQISAADMFQIERGDKVDGESQKKGMMEGVDMEAVSQAMKNSGIDPSVMDQLKKTKSETGSYNMGFDKYKMWMITPAEGLVSSNINSNYVEESSGTMHCGEGQGKGSFKTRKSYAGESQIELSKPGMNNPNGFVLMLNLVNNSYSFTADISWPEGYQFLGNNFTIECGVTTNTDLKINANSFASIVKPGEGLIYKHPLPQDGMILSGSKEITDRFNLWQSLDKEGANWSIKIDWKIYPAVR